MSVKEFSKTLIQIKAIKLLASAVKHIMLYGGSRSGKTFIIVYAIVVRASKVKSRHIMLRKTFNSIKTSIWMDTLPKVMSLCFPDLPYTLDRSNYMMRLINGSEIWVAGLDDDKRVEKILGKEYSTMFFNECSQLSYSAIQTALTRLAEKSELKKKVYYDENPPAKNHWSYWQFIKKINPVDNELLKNENDYAHMLMNPKDNLENIDSEYLDMLSALPEKERARFLDGAFTDDIVKRNGTIFAGLDFNVDPMTCVLGQFVNNEFHIFDEIYLRNSDTPKMCKAIKDKGYSGAKLIPDSTGRNRKTSGKSDFVIIEETFGKGAILSTYNPFVTDRVNNVNRLLSTNRIKINPRCKKLINDLEQVAWKDNKLDQSGDAKLLTHISDCLGYLCWKIEPIKYKIKQASSYTR
jgi:phage terminase large subunit